MQIWTIWCKVSMKKSLRRMDEGRRRGQPGRPDIIFWLLIQVASSWLKIKFRSQVNAKELYRVVAEVITLL